LADTTFTNGVTLSDADWFSDLNRLHYTIFEDPSNAANAWANLIENAAIGGIGKNAIINGAFNIAQRATSFTSTGSANNDDTYTLDRWYILSDGNDIIDVTQESSTVPTNGQYAIALDVETANKKFGIAQIIEWQNCKGLIGNTVTLSFKAKVSATTKLDNVKAAIVAWSGTADSVTSDIISAWGVEGTNPTLIANATYENTPANLSVTTSYATYSVSASVDTASTKNIIVFIWSDVTDTTVGDFLYITDVQLERGSVATEFEHRTVQQEQDLCERYLPAYNAASAATAVISNGYSISSTQALITYPFRVKPRTPPIGLSGSSASTFAVTNGSGSTIEATAVAFDTATPKAATMVVDVAAGLTAGQGTIMASKSASSQLLFTGCEL
jgi:hypothetical protein